MRKADLINSEALSTAYDICFRDETPLLVVLMQRGTITDLLAEQILSMQGRILNGELSLDDAAVKLKSNGHSASDSSGEASNELKPRVLRLGEILMAAELVTSTELVAAVEVARVEKVPFGKLLIRDTSLSEHVLEQAAFVQKQINGNFVTVYDGVQSLVTYAKEHGLSR
jgi:hypothetical protein